MSPDEFKNLAEDVRLIKSAVIGSAQIGHKGLVAQVNSHDIRIGRLEKWYLYVTGAAFMAGLVYTLFKDFVPHR
jgi:hypothetical protein